mmetsp:Transcript_153412/g.268227  ORF Transcript_153412/g.268227 Transcript_153412/m.268227 type:complete len:217 (-) Transcript_153412:1108-1758(-)
MFIIDLLTQGIGKRLQGNLLLHFLTQLFVFDSKILGLLDHALNFLSGQTTFVLCDGNCFTNARRLVFSRHLKNSVFINLESDINFRLATRGWGDSIQFKLAQHAVVFGFGTFSFKDLDQQSGLIVGIGGESFALLGRDRGVPLNQLCHNPPDSLNAHGKGANIHKQHLVLDLVFASQHGTLHCGPIGDCLIRIDAFVGLFSREILLQQLLHFRNTR